MCCPPQSCGSDCLLRKVDGQYGLGRMFDQVLNPGVLDFVVTRRVDHQSKHVKLGPQRKLEVHWQSLGGNL